VQYASKVTVSPGAPRTIGGASIPRSNVGGAGKNVERDDRETGPAMRFTCLCVLSGRLPTLPLGIPQSNPCYETDRSDARTMCDGFLFLQPAPVAWPYALQATSMAMALPASE